MRRFCLFTLLVAAVLAVPVSGAQEPPPEPEAEIIERILELERRIEELLESLSPAAWEELERRRSGGDAAPTAPVEAAPPVVPPVSLPSPPPAAEPVAASCNTLAPFDTTGDGLVTAADRYWRYLYAWSDGNGNRQVEEAEAISLYEAGIRGLAVDLAFLTYADGGRGRVRVDRYVTLELDRGGLSRPRLVVDAGRLGRGSAPQLSTADGRDVTGLQPFEAGWRLRGGEGESTVLLCP